MKRRDLAPVQGRIQEVRRFFDEAQPVVVVFTLCCFAMMMSMGMAFPVFAHLFKQSSSGVVLLSVMMMTPHLALCGLAPLVGSLADRYGRYPFLLLAFAGLFCANLADLFARTPACYLGIQVLLGIVCVGARPAMLGIIAEMVPEQQRARQMSLLMAGFAAGLALGPAAGGFLLQHWGVVAPFGTALVVNLLGLLLLCAMRSCIAPRGTRVRTTSLHIKPADNRLHVSLILPFSFFVSLLVLEFVLSFGRSFVEPQFVLYVTRVLCFSPTRLGLLMSGHGCAMFVGALALSRLGEHTGKRIALGVGFFFQALFPFSLLYLHQFAFLLVAGLLSGAGSGLILPLLCTCFLDSARTDHQSKMQGIKEAAGAVGGIAGSLPAILASHLISSHVAFAIASCIAVGSGLFALYALRPHRPAFAVPSIPASIIPVAAPLAAHKDSLPVVCPEP